MATGYNVCTLDDYYLFVEERIGMSRDGVSNCVGSGLFWVGEVRVDESVEENRGDFVLEVLGEMENAERGMLVGWERYPDIPKLRYYCHLGVVTCADPVLVTHRWGVWGYMKHDQPLGEIDSVHFSDSKIRYFVPSMMELL